MRGLSDPDAFLPSDLGVRRALEALDVSWRGPREAALTGGVLAAVARVRAAASVGGARSPAPRWTPTPRPAPTLAPHVDPVSSGR